MTPEVEEQMIERVMAAREVENERRIKGGRDIVPASFRRIVEDYEPPRGGDFFPSPLSVDRVAEMVTFGRTRYLVQQRDFLDALTAIAMRDRRIAELEVELARERASAKDWRTMCEMAAQR